MAETWKHWEGRTIDGKFPLVQFLGESDHSAVFLTERGAGKAALKLISVSPQTADVQLKQWASASKLDHPRLVRLFEMGRCELGEARLLYLVMEFADEDLSQVLPQRSLTAEETTEMLPPVLDALAYVHAHGFTHTRLKPSNIMGIQDQVKISSDGLLPVGENSRDTKTLSAYDPPEAARGQSVPASDVWSLGMTLVEVLTQRLSARENAVTAEPVLPGTMPEPFQSIARQCLVREPERRLTVAQIAARLLPSPTAQPIAVEKPEAYRKPRYWVPVLAIGLVAAAILITVRSGGHGPNPEPRPPAATEVLPQSKPQAANPEPVPSKGQVRDTTETSRTAAPSHPSVAMGGKSVSGTRGAVVQQVLPDVSPSARRTIEGRIRVNVKVSVNPSGDVAGATLDKPGPSQYFARIALQAAEKWKFTPPQVEGKNVASEWMLKFQFKNNATEAFPEQTAP
jgi:TonB family protein